MKHISAKLQNRTLKTLLMVMVAYITFFGAVFLSVSSEASVAQPGTFIPSECGQAVNQPYVSKVCRGHIAGETAETAMGAFEFRDEKGRPAVYRVTEVSNLLIKLLSGGTRAQVFMVGPNGDQISMKINRLPNGLLQAASGTIGQANYFVPEFSPVMTTMASL